ncbi:MAG: hypothetical protein JWQ48_3436 [Conexibacter sp.]|nr:hypothetical protein [Conexibacter sp.]
MFHPTARRLDEPYKAYGFTVPQWAALIFGGGGAIAAMYFLHVGVQAGGFFGTLIVGMPALYWLLLDDGRIQPTELLLDALRKLAAPRQYRGGRGERPAGLLIDGDSRHAINPDAAGLEIPWD